MYHPTGRDSDHSYEELWKMPSHISQFRLTASNEPLKVTRVAKTVSFWSQICLQNIDFRDFEKSENPQSCRFVKCNLGSLYQREILFPISIYVDFYDFLFFSYQLYFFRPR